MTISNVTLDYIARVAHEVNRAYCSAIGDNSQLSWEDAADWQRESAINGVRYALTNDSVTPEEQHDAWSLDKIQAGWKWGPVKDPDKKEHPCLVRYDELPLEQKVKDYLFRAVVSTLK